MSERSADWMAQARRDLEHAAKEVRDRCLEHACFEAQQAAEKAVKAVFIGHHADSRGHSVSRLVQESVMFTAPPDAALVDDAHMLDRYCIPTRYPNGFESGAPKDYFTEEQARDAVRRVEKASLAQW